MAQPAQIKIDVFVGSRQNGTREKMIHLRISENNSMVSENNAVVSEYAMSVALAGVIARQLQDCVDELMEVAAKSLPIRKIEVVSGRF